MPSITRVNPRCDTRKSKVQRQFGLLFEGLSPVSQGFTAIFSSAACQPRMPPDSRKRAASAARRASVRRWTAGNRGKRLASSFQASTASGTSLWTGSGKFLFAPCLLSPSVSALSLLCLSLWSSALLADCSTGFGSSGAPCSTMINPAFAKASRSTGSRAPIFPPTQTASYGIRLSERLASNQIAIKCALLASAKDAKS